MKRSIDEILELVKEMKNKYLSDRKYQPYIEKVFASYFTANSKDEYCIKVLLKEEIPEHLEFPNSYKNTRIIFEYKF